MSVSSPAPPTNRSCPAPPRSWSLPGPPSRVSLPPCPDITSFPPSPQMTSLPAVPMILSGFAVPVIVHVVGLVKGGAADAADTFGNAAAMTRHPKPAPINLFRRIALSPNASCLLPVHTSQAYLEWVSFQARGDGWNSPTPFSVGINSDKNVVMGGICSRLLLERNQPRIGRLRCVHRCESSLSEGRNVSFSARCLLR